MIILLTGCGGDGTPRRDRVIAFCQSHQEKLEHVRDIVRRKGQGALDRILDRLPDRARMLVEECLNLKSVPDIQPTPVDRTTPTSLKDSTRFLYTGEDPVQTGVDSGTIQHRRASVIRGRVLDGDGNPLSGATVRILNHPEYGRTVSRSDGYFDMAVNGGGRLTVRVTHPSRLPVQRSIAVDWRQMTRMEPFRLTSIDPNVTTVDLTNDQTVQVHEATTQSDSDGTRTTRLAFKPRTEATLVGTDGSTESIDTLDVRATEYTVGPNGDEKMPAALPSNTQYTYAVELSVDRVLQDTSVQQVEFSRPVSLYVDNFLGAPVGSPIPSGFYDRTRGQWVPADTGARVMEVVNVQDNQALLDVDGDGQADGPNQLTSLGITERERSSIARQFDAGDSFWRAPVTHMTPWDLNHPLRRLGPTPRVEPGLPEGGQYASNACESNGSTIEIQNQVLGEALPLVGTPFSLHYRSNRTVGFRPAYTLNIPISNESVAGNLHRIAVDVEVAGRQFGRFFEPAPNLTHTFEWDGKDAYGRTLQGPQRVDVAITYLYPGVYGILGRGPNQFGKIPGIPVSTLEARRNVDVVQQYQKKIGTFRSKALKMGGWSLSVHHTYDPGHQILYRGDGTQRRADLVSQTIRTVVGTGEAGYSGDSGPASEAQLYHPIHNEVAPDGSIYIVESGNNTIRRVSPEGTIQTIAGNGQEGFTEDGQPARGNSLTHPTDLALGSNGTVYFAEEGSNRIRKITDDGRLQTVAGNGQAKFGGDGGPAVEASLNDPWAFTLGPDGSFFIGDVQNNRIRQVTPDGIIHTVAGTGENGFGGDGGPAAKSVLNFPNDMAVDEEGTLYVADSWNGRIRKITSDGTIETVVGGGSRNPQDGLAATEVSFSSAIFDVTVAPDGTIYFTHGYRNVKRIWMVTPQGTLTTLAGTGERGFSGDGEPPTRAQVNNATNISLDGEGNLYISDFWNHRIRKIEPVLPDVSLDRRIVADKNGSRLFVFSATGRHLRTVDARTGTTLFRFEYNDQGLLSGVSDRDGQTTTIERNSNGQATAVISPFGQRTELTTNASGFLTEARNPAGEAHQMTYSDSGLLTTFTDPNGNQTNFEYSEDGRLARETDPAGGFLAFARTVTDTGYRVTQKTALGRTSTVGFGETAVGNEDRINRGPEGLPRRQNRNRDATESIRLPAGNTLSTVEGPDPRFDMQSPIAEAQTVRTPAGRTMRLSTSSSAVAGANLGVDTSMDTVTVNGRQLVQRYRDENSTLTTQSPEGRTAEIQFNDRGRVARRQQGDLLSTTFTYNDRGQLTQQTRGDRTSTFTYNDDGYLSSRTDPVGRTTEFTYDEAGRVTSRSLPGGRRIDYQYDANGNLTTLTLPGRNAHRFRYTNRDQTQEYDPPSLPSGATVTTWTYNRDQQLTQIQQPDMTTVNFEYDQAGRLSAVDFPTARRTRRYSSSTGNLTAIQSSKDVDLAFTHDGSLPTRVEWQGADVSASLAVEYNDNFQVVRQVLNDNRTITFDRDRDGLLTRAGNLNLTRDGTSGLLASTSLDGVQTTLSRNDFGEVVGQSSKHGGSTLYSLNVERDTAGRVINQREDVVGGLSRERTFEYDDAGRLVGVKRRSGESVTYDYDANGNRTARTGADVDQTNFQYDDQDRLRSYRKNGDTLVAFNYTANGDLQERTVGEQAPTTYHYDARGNLRTVTLKGDTSIEYLIDGRNRRVGKRVNGQFTQGFLYQDRLNPVAELDQNGDLESIFVYGARDNVPAYMIKDGTAYRIISNHLGSVRLVVNSQTGEVVQRMRYDAFGRVILDTNPGFQPFGFAGGLYDSQTGLVRFGARDYDPRVGRWTTKDPILFAGGSANLYGYVLNDPVNATDASGRAYGEAKICLGLGPFGCLGAQASGSGVNVIARGGAGAGFDASAGIKTGDLPCSDLNVKGTLSGDVTVGRKVGVGLQGTVDTSRAELQSSIGAGVGSVGGNIGVNRQGFQSGVTGGIGPATGSVSGQSGQGLSTQVGLEGEAGASLRGSVTGGGRIRVLNFGP